MSIIIFTTLFLIVLISFIFCAFARKTAQKITIVMLVISSPIYFLVMLDFYEYNRSFDRIQLEEIELFDSALFTEKNETYIAFNVKNNSNDYSIVYLYADLELTDCPKDKVEKSKIIKKYPITLSHKTTSQKFYLMPGETGPFKEKVYNLKPSEIDGCDWEIAINKIKAKF